MIIRRLLLWPRRWPDSLQYHIHWISRYPKLMSIN